MDHFHATVYGIVRDIPPGCVSTYGRIAALAGFPRNARQVGSALKVLPAQTDVPWHRVVQSSGGIALRGGGEARQRALLELEGVEVAGPAPGGSVKLRDCEWIIEDDHYL